jgi:hypothetical protein
MTTEFFSIAKYKMAMPEGITGVSGGIILPALIQRPTLIRRDLDRTHPHLKRRLMDPQVYLSNLAANTCRSACKNLASYGWFPLIKPIKEFKSSRQKQSEWAKLLSSQIDQYWQGRVPTRQEDIEDSIRQSVELQMSWVQIPLCYRVPHSYMTGSA